MKKYSAIFLSVMGLLAVVIFTSGWTRSFYRSVQTYQSPLYDLTLPASASELPQTARVRVVLVVISGLGADIDQETLMPALARISQTSADAVMQGIPPTYGQTSLATLVTGAPPDTNGALPIDTPNPPLLAVDTIFARAHSQQHQTALLGDAIWRQLIPRNHLDETMFVNGAGPEADQLMFENALLLLTEEETDLILLQFGQLKAAGQLFGTDSAAYRQAAGQIDRYLAEIHQLLDFSQTVLVILGEHGLTEEGGFGGAEASVTQLPLVLTGNMIAPGTYSAVSATDIAPTVATLLGVSAPTAAQGRVLYELLRLDDRLQAVAQLGVAQQRVTLAQAYAASLESDPTPLLARLEDDVTRAQTALTNNNANGAYELVLLAQTTADSYMETLRQEEVGGGQSLRLVMSLLALGVWSLLLWRLRGPYASVIVFAALVVVGLYHILYQLQGFEYSISTFKNIEALPFSISRRTTVSLLAGGGLLLILLMLVNESNWVTLLGTGYGFSVLVTFLFSLPLFWAFWQNGWSVAQTLPDVSVVFWQITASYEAMIAAIIGLFLPWPIMLLLTFVGAVRRSLDKSTPPPEADALPGLHM